MTRINRAIWAAVLIFCAPAISAHAQAEDHLAGFRSVQTQHIARGAADDPMQLINRLWSTYPMLLKAEGSPELNIRLHPKGAALIGDVIITGYPDDSVGGEWVRLEFNRLGDKWEIARAGRKFLCRRGAAGWTDGACP